MFKPFEMLSREDKEIAAHYLGSLTREPDITIAPDGKPYLYRWHLLRSPRGAVFGGCIYFHMQIADDPERPLHDHPWDNMSVILAGGYLEWLQPYPPNGYIVEAARMKGDVVFRKAEAAHRLLMLEDHPYTLTQFTTGPRVREWGFWYPEGWCNYREVTELRPGGVSVHLTDTSAQGGTK